MRSRWTMNEWMIITEHSFLHQLESFLRRSSNIELWRQEGVQKRIVQRRRRRRSRRGRDRSTFLRILMRREREESERKQIKDRLISCRRRIHFLVDIPSNQFFCSFRQLEFIPLNRIKDHHPWIRKECITWMMQRRIEFPCSHGERIQNLNVSLKLLQERMPLIV